MGISQKYECGGKYFRFICDASEFSWQKSKKVERVSEDYSIITLDDNSYGVFDNKNKELVVSFPVIALY